MRGSIYSAAPRSIRAGRRMALREAMGLRAYSAGGRGRWRHPWHVSCGWRGEPLNQWIAVIKPGFVNGRAPVWRTTIGEMKANPRDYGINPLDGVPYFSSYIFKQRETATGPEERVDLPLYLSPAIGLSWRAIGFDGPGGQAVPAFFRRRGAADSPFRHLDFEAPLDTNGAAQQLAEPPRGLRLLRACDVWLHQPRNALTSTIEVLPGAATGVSIFNQTLGVVGADRGDALRIMSGNFDPLTRGFEPLQRDYSEFPYDEKLLATVYLLSPPNAVPGSEPDGSWQPFVQHEVFWNLTWTQPEFRQPVSVPGATLLPLLGTFSGAAAAPVINYVSASINDVTQDMLNLLRGHSLAGRFWTPTGGGWSAAFPAEPPAPAEGATGLDKSGRLRAREVARQVRESDSLDPGFPYRGLPFDPKAFGLLN